MTERQRLSISAEEYHQRPEVSSSGVRLFESKGPLQYWATYITREKTWDETDSQRLGTALHLAFERHDWKRWIDVVPATIEDHPCIERINLALDVADSKATRLVLGAKLNKKFPAHASYVEARKADAIASGKTWMTTAEHDQVAGQLEAILADPKCRELIERGGKREQPGIARDSSSGLMIRALADVDQGDYGFDAKTTRHYTSNLFRKDVFKFRYHLQLDFYSRVFGWENAGLIAVTSDSPYFALHYELDDETKEEARKRNDHALADIASRMSGDSKSKLSWMPEGYGRTSIITLTGVDNDPIQWDE